MQHDIVLWIKNVPTTVKCSYWYLLSTSTHKMMLYILLFNQEDYADYGIDWSGPVAEDDNTVVPELPSLLSTVQLQHLSTILEHMANNSSDGECLWIEQYLESRCYTLDAVYLQSNIKFCWFSISS